MFKSSRRAAQKAIIIPSRRREPTSQRRREQKGRAKRKVGQTDGQESVLSKEKNGEYRRAAKSMPLLGCRDTTKLRLAQERGRRKKREREKYAGGGGSGMVRVSVCLTSEYTVQWMAVRCARTSRSGVACAGAGRLPVTVSLFAEGRHAWSVRGSFRAKVQAAELIGAEGRGQRSAQGLRGLLRYGTLL